MKELKPLCPASHDTPSPKKARLTDAALDGVEAHTRDALAPDELGSGGGGGTSHARASTHTRAAWGWTDRQAASPLPLASHPSTSSPPLVAKSESGGGSAPSPASPKPTPRSREPPATPPGPRANPPATTGGGGGAGAVLDARREGDAAFLVGASDPYPDPEVSLSLDMPDDSSVESAFRALGVGTWSNFDGMLR
ncbi:hypothetical protein EMIHUDRAFT_435267 [Emiliania huxleyi CCMP1516]|uniref:Uncharacterized protein n=2 Tax=Emiliania huxleyi TaxID=2903 RepID=A0A0D3JNN8_EMIH1|nr:hypothetical protein EMIHUDRAFT_435267 [Emiliania huxleyi CCMP1516]EOD25123.1 hypothetical protein EMIHUDRAFT_435267 [Emiliania huxleyi CCMP1516]|eukprot:XP_005777552.1 hypothetical protein EMIHUDRAFT_435267 [Emiliania huxleyi CCMP1516]